MSHYSTANYSYCFKATIKTYTTIATKFNTYRFADYKEQAIDLLKRVCTVSVGDDKDVTKINL